MIKFKFLVIKYENRYLKANLFQENTIFLFTEANKNAAQLLVKS